ncbi:MAG: hypothetical protein KDB80_01075, partial [Planctomycetes bacterium]|nr:hypothetical protein [Planctomycetota bacterium]
MSEIMPRRTWLWMIGVAFLWRAFVSLLTPVPAEDGVNYLWMAQRFAENDVAAALSEVFPPLWSLAIAPFVALGIDPFRAGQFVAAVCGALTLVPVVRVTAILCPAAVRAAAWFVIFAPLPTRLGAEVYTEPMFHLVAGLATWNAMRGRPVEAGMWSGFATWVRPEGILVAVAFAIVERRAALRLLLSAAIPVLALGLWRQRAVGEFIVFPKASFNADRLWDEVPGLLDFTWHWLGNAVEIPWLWCEAFAVVGVLAVLGMFRGRSRGSRPLTIMIALGIVLICGFLPRRRFLVSWFVAVVPLAAMALRSLGRPRDAVFILAMLANILLSLRIQEPNRIAERRVGEYLGEQLAPGDLVAGDMTRVLWFAGRRPLPPKHFTADELIERARLPRVRFVVLGARREVTAEVV